MARGERGHVLADDDSWPRPLCQPGEVQDELPYVALLRVGVRAHLARFGQAATRGAEFAARRRAVEHVELTRPQSRPRQKVFDRGRIGRDLADVALVDD